MPAPESFASPVSIPLPLRSSARWAMSGFEAGDGARPQLVQAIGARVWSADGAEYVDFDNAGGAVLLGHRDPAVIAAVRMARSRDERRGLDRYKADVAELIQAMAPGAESAAFGADVSQVLRAALTAARLHTGRERIYACRSAGRGGSHAGYLGGLPTFPFDELPALERLLEHDGPDVAALVLAPSSTRAPSPGYLAGVRSLADRHGAVLIFDEALTGFRVHEGGAQALWGVEADMTVFGESLANGMPIGALAGRRDLVTLARGAEYLNADVASLAAAKAVLTKIGAEPVIAALRIAGAEVQAETGALLRAAGLEDAVTVEGDPAAMRVVFRPGALGLPESDAASMQYLWISECHAHRLFTLGALNMSYAHGDREIGVLLAALHQAVDGLSLALRLAPVHARRAYVRASA